MSDIENIVKKASIMREIERDNRVKYHMIIKAQKREEALYGKRCEIFQQIIEISARFKSVIHECGFDYKKTFYAEFPAYRNHKGELVTYAISFFHGNAYMGEREVYAKHTLNLNNVEMPDRSDGVAYKTLCNIVDNFDDTTEKYLLETFSANINEYIKERTDTALAEQRVLANNLGA